MAPPNTLALQKLYRLDASSSDFQDKLCDILHGDEYLRCLPSLEGGDLVWFVEYLDKILDVLEPSGIAFRRCLRELRSVCGAKQILPTSYLLSSRLLDVSPKPFASGGFGDVYRGTLNGSSVCIKNPREYIQDDQGKVVKAFYQEAVMWKRLKHPNIIPLLGITIFPQLQLVSEWMTGGDLPGYIKENPGLDRLGLLFDVADGLHYLHSCNVVHGDLKGANVLVDNAGRARIADFGLTMVAKNQNTIPSTSLHAHTPRWTAPEILGGGQYSREADIFSFAMVMYEIFAGTVPFHEKAPPAAMFDIMSGTRPPRPTHPALTEKLWSLMERCWAHDPQVRPGISEALQSLTPDPPPWRQLITQTLTTEERISLITAIFSDHDQVTVVGNLQRDDAQALVDVINQEFNHLTTEIRRQSLSTMYNICNRQVLVPQSLKIPLNYDATKNPLCQGRHSDVWKTQYSGKVVAVRVLRVHSTSDDPEIRSKFCGMVTVWGALDHPNVLPLLGVTMTEARFVMVSRWMEKGNINEFVEANPAADRLQLLSEVAEALIYLHDLGIIHGNLKGMEILVDDVGHPRLSGFSSFTMMSGTPPSATSGTHRWMAPELLDPESSSPHNTRESDCYSLGMVIYEVLSGEAPFAATRHTYRVIAQVLAGVRPTRPQGTQGSWFTDALWEMLELCWRKEPDERPHLHIILRCLQDVTRPKKPISGVDADIPVDADPGTNHTANESDFLEIAQSDNGLPATAHSPSIVESTVEPQGDDQISNVDEEGTALWLARAAWGMFIHIL